MASTKVNRAGLRKLRRSPAVRKELVAIAERVAAEAGGEDAGYFVDSQVQKNRARAAVVADREGMNRERKGQTLTRAFFGGL